MKIAWFTPFSIKSAIGRYSQIATNAISKEHEVDIWVERGDEVLQKTYLNIHRFSPNSESDAQQLKAYDVVVYNLGDNSIYHKGIYEMYIKSPGVVILHDISMINFFRGYFYLNRNQTGFDETLKLLLPSKQLGPFEKLAISLRVNRKIDESETPFFEPALINALGVITHSDYAKKEVSKKYPGPCIHIDFPFIFDRLNNKNTDRESQVTGKLRLLTIGNVNSNKRIDKVINAIGQNGYLRKHIHYDVVGYYDESSIYFEHLNALVSQYHLQDSVRFHAYVEEDTLRKFIKATDVCVNLRFPVLNAASWSLLDEFSYGKAVIVTNSGFFQELPENTVFKVPPNESEIKVLTEVLFSLAENRRLAQIYGTRAYEYARSTFSTDQYSKEFGNFMKDVTDNKNNMKLVLRVARELGTFSNELNQKTFQNLFDRINSITDITSK